MIGDNIRKYRQAANMEQSDLAERLHISNKTVSSWECGRTEPRMGMDEAKRSLANKMGAYFS